MATNKHLIQYEKERAQFVAEHQEELKTKKLFDVILEGDGLWHAHKSGCQDVAKTMTKKFVNGVSPYVASDVTDLLDQIIDEEMQEMGYTANDVVVLPCCTK